MDILKSFVLDGSEFAVNVMWDDGKPFFRATEIGAVLGLEKVRTTIAHFDTDEKEEKVAHSMGGRQNTVFLTEAGLYRLLMISRKPIARPFQKWVTSVLVSIRENGKYEIQKYVQDLENEKALHAATSSQLDALAREFKDIATSSVHKSHVEAFANKYVVYFGRIRRLGDGDTHLIKIGSTKNLRTRAVDVVSEFGSMEIFNVFECPCNEKFEKFLHNHKDIQKHAYRDVIHEGRRSHEVFALNDVDLLKAVSIAKHNVHRFRQNVSDIELEKIKLKHVKEIKELFQATAGVSAAPPTDTMIQAVVEARVAGLGGAAVDPVLLFADNRQYTQALGAKVQRYSPDGKTLLQTYESAIAALRDASLDAPSRTRIHQAVADRTVYKDFRWMFLDRALPNDTVQVLGETAQKERDIRKGFVAMLNLDKTQIMEVFQNQKEAGIDRKFRSSAPVCTSLKNGTQSGGHYFKMWYDCPDDLKAEFLSRKSLPDKAVPGGQRVVQLHPITRDVVRVYASVSDVIKDHRFSRSSLKNVIENGFIAKGYRWSSSKPA